MAFVSEILVCGVSIHALIDEILGDLFLFIDVFIFFFLHKTLISSSKKD